MGVFQEHIDWFTYISDQNTLGIHNSLDVTLSCRGIFDEEIEMHILLHPDGYGGRNGVDIRDHIHDVRLSGTATSSIEYEHGIVVFDKQTSTHLALVSCISIKDPQLRVLCNKNLYEDLMPGDSVMIFRRGYLFRDLKECAATKRDDIDGRILSLNLDLIGNDSQVIYRSRIDPFTKMIEHGETV